VAEYLLQHKRYDLAAHITEDNASTIQNLRLRAREWLTLADIYRLKGDFFAARLYAEKAAEDYPGWGLPYLFLARLYTFSAPFCNFTLFERKALNWLALDCCRKAMEINPRLQADALVQMARYESELPTRDECFANGLRQGATFLVGCWINEATRVMY
jgi:tetratricopeptide (TPR) repeat protein